jgi:hypothetical protein
MHLQSRFRFHGFLALALLALTAVVSACNRKPAVEPAPPSAPAQRPQTPEAATPAPASPAIKRQLQVAEDLFNRGENELACELVEAVEKPGASSNEEERWKRFRDACTQAEPTP